MIVVFFQSHNYLKINDESPGYDYIPMCGKSVYGALTGDGVLHTQSRKLCAWWLRHQNATDKWSAS